MFGLLHRHPHPIPQPSRRAFFTRNPRTPHCGIYPTGGGPHFRAPQTRGGCVCACARVRVRVCLKSTLSRFSQAGHQERHLTRLLPPHGWREHDGMGHMTQAAIGQAQCRSLSLHSRALHKPPYFQENVLRAAGRQARLGAPRRSFAFTCILIANDHFNLKPSNFI